MKKILAISITAFILIFMVGTTLATADGVPFEALQQQIDDLQEQINDLQQGCIPAAYSTYADPEVVEVEPRIVMEKLLPSGVYVSNISLGGKYGNFGFDPECWAFLDCQIVDGVTNLPIAGGVGGNVVGIMTHSSTEILTLQNNTIVALQCSEGSSLCDYEPYPKLEVGGSWTFIEVNPQ